MSIGKRIQAIRKTRGYSQEQLASLLNVSRQALSKWEGDVNLPSIDKLIDLARILECSVNELLGIEEKQGHLDIGQLEELLNQLLLDQRKQHQRKKQGMIVSGIVVVAILFVGVVGYITLSKRMDYLNSNLHLVQDNIISENNNNMTNITDQLEKQNSILSSLDYSVVAGDIDKQTMDIAFEVVAKEYKNDSVVSLDVITSGGTKNTKLKLESGIFKGKDTFKLGDLKKIIVTISGDKLQSQTYEINDDILTKIEVGGSFTSFYDEKTKINEYYIEASTSTALFDEKDKGLQDLANDNGLSSGSVEIYYNYELIDTKELMLNNKGQLTFKYDIEDKVKNLKHGDRLELKYTIYEKSGKCSTFSNDYMYMNDSKFKGWF